MKPQRGPAQHPARLEDPLYRTHPAFAEDRARDEGRQLETPHYQRLILTQFILFVVILILWPLPVINPIKLMVVVFHEMSHMAAAYATGGVVFGMAIDPGGAGVTMGLDGDPLLIVAMGYVGSMGVGLLLYLLVAIWEPNEVWTVLLALCGLSLAFKWLNDFTAFFGYGTLFLMLLGGFFLGPNGKRLILRWVATTCCLYSTLDILSEAYFVGDSGFMIGNQIVASDVTRMAFLSGIPQPVLTFTWLVLGMGMVSWMTFWSARKEATTIVKRSLLRRDPPMDYVRATFYADPTNPPRYHIRG